MRNPRRLVPDFKSRHSNGMIFANRTIQYIATPVSYTHLDVHKRQTYTTYTFSESRHISSSAGNKDNGKVSHNGDGKDCHCRAAVITLAESCYAVLCCYRAFNCSHSIEISFSHCLCVMILLPYCQFC